MANLMQSFVQQLTGCAHTRHDSSRDTDTTQNKCPKYCVSLCFVNFPCYNMRIDIFKLRKRPARGGGRDFPLLNAENVENIILVCIIGPFMPLATA